MLYKFKSKAASDLIMTGAHGDAVLRGMGREPAPKGIVQPEQMPAALAALEAAVEADEAERKRQDEEADAEGRPRPSREGVSFKQRAWPMIEMLRRAHAAGKDIVWGV
ncbi:DUF1840 domain-containing protein [Caldimonas sp. KR1-144]|uniref:DUF1840 domain-containing protein n=1 Tax=Caldimonas sp. KR1-144 TaxID=3400911 RepID=UPI003C03955E